MIGVAVAKEIVKVFDTYESFREAVAAKYNFSQMPNFGYEKTQAILTFDYSSADKIREFLNLTNKSNEPIGKSLEGLTFVITGKNSLFKNRTELKAFIESNGGRLVDSVTTKTSYLINNDINSNTGKNKTAKALRIPIITEEQFKNLLN